MYAAAVRLPALLLALGLVLASAPAAHAQSVGPVPVFVADLRGFYSGLGQDPVTAFQLEVPPTSLPSRGLGGVVGVHLYVFRRARFAFGVGGEAMMARGSKDQVDADGLSTAPPIQQRIRSLSGNISINFGDENGWSYLTAGIGPLSFVSFVGDSAPDGAVPRKTTLNLGGGARWFFSRHVAIEFDVRFYQTKPEDIVPPYPGRQRNKLTVLSGGIGIK